MDAHGTDEHGTTVLTFVGANAPDNDSEDREYERVRFMRAFDRSMWLRLDHGRKRSIAPAE